MKKLIVLPLCLPLLWPVWAGAENLYWRPASECPTNGDGTAFACASSEGGEGAWSGASSNVLYATSDTAARVDYGDTLYVCGDHPAGLQTGAMGAPPSVVDDAGDYFTISGDCEDGIGSISNPSADVASGHGILASGRTGIYVENLNFKNTWRSGFQNFVSSSSACTSAQGFYCVYAKNITCSGVGQSEVGHCVQSTSSAFGNFPSAAIGGVQFESVTSNGAAGAACNVSGHYDSPQLINCTSVGDGLYQDTWGVYIRSEAINIGNCGAGQTWTQLNSSTVLKATVATSCIPAGLTWLKLQHLVVETGQDIPGTFTKDAACTNDTTCEAEVGQGEWGQVGNVVYINRGTTSVQPAASVQITLAYNTGAKITGASATDFGDTHDGVGIGCDLDAINCTIERSKAWGQKYGFSCSSAECTIRSSVAWDNTIGNYSLGYRGNAKNVSSSFTAETGTHFLIRSNFGSDITINNAALIGGDVSLSDLWDDGGTINWDYNGHQSLTFEAEVGSPAVPATPISAGANDVLADPAFVVSRPTTAEGFRTKAGSPLRGAGTRVSGVDSDYGNRRFKYPPSIGAWEYASGDTADARTIAAPRTLRE